MICLLLIMTMITINSIESSEQKARHPDTVLREEEMNAKTKAWLLMVESGKVDEEELRRITPKSIFIAPLLSSRTMKCKEGYRHDHLGQCVKIIKIDPKIQLESLLQKLNKLYGEEKKEKEEFFELSSGPLQFSIPISNNNNNNNNNDTSEKTKNETKPEAQLGTNVSNAQSAAEIMPTPLPVISQDDVNQTKEIESSASGPLNDTEQYENTQIEGSGATENPQEEETTVSVSLLSEEADYLDVGETESTTAPEIHTTTETPEETYTTETTTENAVNETDSVQSYPVTNPPVNDSVEDLSKDVQKPEVVKSQSKSDVIHFPNDDEERTQFFESTRIRFPDEMSQPPAPSYQPLPATDNLNSKFVKYQIHPSTIPRDQFWWLPENWKVDESQYKSPLVKVWSRLPLIHDISYDDEVYFKKPFPSEPSLLEVFNSQNKNREFPSYSPGQPTVRSKKPFRSNRFQEVIPTPRQSYRIQR